MRIINKFLLCFGFVLIMASCQKDNVETISIDILTDKLKYKIGDTVNFILSSNSDMITFYSGENGNVYKFKDRTELVGGVLEMKMETMELYGVQDQNLNFLISTDFTGNYTKSGVEEATWINLTDRIKWNEAPSGAVGVRTWSDNVVISDVLVSGKPIYFAYRYVGLPSTTGAAQQRTWRVYNFEVTNKFSETEVSNVASRSTAGWQSVTINDPAGKGVWVFTDATMIYYNPESNTQAVEKWAISKRFDPNKANPDNGVSIKKYPDNPLTKYQYVYNKSGEYEVTFVFTNANYTGTFQEVKTIKIFVE